MGMIDYLLFALVFVTILLAIIVLAVLGTLIYSAIIDISSSPKPITRRTKTGRSLKLVHPKKKK